MWPRPLVAVGLGALRTPSISPTSRRSGPVGLSVYDIAGRQVRGLVNGVLEAGFHQRVWDGRSDSGSMAPAGMYFYRLSTPEGARVRRMIFLH